jgi:hypothetical protein
VPLPPDHQRRLAPGRSLSSRERGILRGVGAVAVALIVAVAISLASGGRSSGHGCIHAVFPGPVGAEVLDRCGTAARSLCGSAAEQSGYGPEGRRTIAAECRKAGFRVAYPNV